MNIEQIVDMIHNDIPNDEMSLLWDGTEMRMVSDPLDQEGIFDGRSGPYAYARLKAAIGYVYTVDREELLSEEHVAQNDAEDFCSETANRYIHIYFEKYSFSQAQETHASNLAEKRAADYTLERSGQYLAEQTIITARDGRQMFGLRVIVPDGDATVKVYEYAGMGLCPDILVEAEMMAERTIED